MYPDREKNLVFLYAKVAFSEGEYPLLAADTSVKNFVNV